MSSSTSTPRRSMSPEYRASRSGLGSSASSATSSTLRAQPVSTSGTASSPKVRTRSGSNLLSAGMQWLPKLDKDDFVGKWAVEQFSDRDERERLVGFTMEENVVPPEGAQLVIDGRPAGRVTSARRSEAVGDVIGLAWVPPDRSEDGTRVEIRVGRRVLGARV